MTRRTSYPLFGIQYCGNKKRKEVHDLDNENVNCQIDKIIHSGHLRAFNPDSLEQAHRERYDDCAFCIKNNHR